MKEAFRLFGEKNIRCNLVIVRQLSKTMKSDLEAMVNTEIHKLLSKSISYNEAAGHFKSFLLSLSKQNHTSPILIIDQVILYHRQSTNLTDNIALDFLNAYRVSAISRRRKGTSQQIKEASQGKVKLDSSSLNEVVLSQNRARGKTFENMGSVLVEHYLRHIENYSGPLNISADRTIFESIDSQGRQSKRRYDLYLPDFKIGVEIKSGRISYQNSIKDQIYKDHYLLKKKLVSDVWWFLFYGASQKVLTELLKRKINFIDLGFNDFEDEPKS